MKIQGQIQLTARGRLCLILLHLTAGAAWLTRDDTARLAASMLAAPFLVDLLYKRFWPPRFALSLGARRTEAGSSFVETLELHNLAPRRAARQLAVSEPRTATQAGGAQVPSLPPAARCRVRLGARSRRRGLVAERTFVVETSHPLGMFRWRAVLTGPAELCTEPARVELDRELLAALDAGREDMRPGQRLEGQDYFCLREYRHGEDARHVQARRSASLGTLVSKVYRGRQEPQCSLVIDMRRRPGMPPAFNNRPFERCLSIAASLCDALCARGARFLCFAVDRGVQRWSVDSALDAREFLRYLARAQSVPYFSLASPAGGPGSTGGSADLFAELPDDDVCFWIPAGGYRNQRAAARVPALHLLPGEAS